MANGTLIVPRLGAESWTASSTVGVDSLAVPADVPKPIVITNGDAWHAPSSPHTCAGGHARFGFEHARPSGYFGEKQPARPTSSHARTITHHISRTPVFPRSRSRLLRLNKA